MGSRRISLRPNIDLRQTPYFRQFQWWSEAYHWYVARMKVSSIEPRVWIDSLGGRNGYGAKVTNIFSKKFTIETSSKEFKKSFKQVCLWSQWISRDDRIGRSSRLGWTTCVIRKMRSSAKAKIRRISLGLHLSRIWNVFTSKRWTKITWLYSNVVLTMSPFRLVVKFRWMANEFR